MQTILGSGGAIGAQLAKALPKYTDKIRLVSRNPKKANPGDELFSADLTDAEAVDRAVNGSEIAYLTAGLVYKTNVWQKSWPVIMNNVIQACLKHKCKLVFFDNIYIYDGTVLNPITETTPINPPSEKGKVRAKIVKMIEDARQKGLVALIARAADFYGPSIKNVSVLTETVIKPLSEGKTANWLGDDTKKHSYTYVPDAGKATALLGNTPEAYGEVWHLPTAKNPPTGKEWVEMIAAEIGAKPKYRVVGKGMVKFMGLFMSIMKESVEMMYQNDRDYVFDSSKFESKFDFKPTPYLKGIQEIVSIDYNK
jgi:nucleoside-diphosphate-sugar epimerase